MTIAIPRVEEKIETKKVEYTESLRKHSVTFKRQNEDSSA